MGHRACWRSPPYASGLQVFRVAERSDPRGIADHLLCQCPLPRVVECTPTILGDLRPRGHYGLTAGRQRRVGPIAALGQVLMLADHRMQIRRRVVLPESAWREIVSGSRL